MSVIISTMAASEAISTQSAPHENRGRDLFSTGWALAALLTAGFLVRCFNSWYRYLNADEALHYLLSVQDSLAATYRASLTTAHPPFLIVWLHCWGNVGQSEFFLRFPCVIAGTAFCWILFLWLRRVANERVAMIAFVLSLFLPPVIQLSAEVRQYSFLLFFCAASLYWLERALDEQSVAKMLISGAALYLALLTHYSSLLFALAIGVYALARFLRKRSMGTLGVWIAIQVGALALFAFFFVHHVSRIENSGQAESIATTYLSRSILQAGQNPLWFVARSNIRLFDYFFSQAAVGSAALVLFVIGIVVLLRGKPDIAGPRRPKALALLLITPFVANCCVALLRIYPYGGTRHDSYLVLFAIPGIAIAIAQWTPRRRWIVPAVLYAVLLACNLFPTPLGEYIRLRDQSRTLIAEAVNGLRSQPADAPIFTDDQGGLLLSYYMCGVKVVQIEESPFQPFMRTRCGEHWVISLDPDKWIFKGDTFPDTLRRLQATYGMRAGDSVTVFQAGWFIDKEADFKKVLSEYGCAAPSMYGANILACRLTLTSANGH